MSIGLINDRVAAFADEVVGDEDRGREKGSRDEPTENHSDVMFNHSVRTRTNLLTGDPLMSIVDSDYLWLAK